MRRANALIPLLTPPQQADFDQWWSAWPRKVGKLDAMRAWVQSQGIRPPIAQMLALLDQQRRQAGWMKDGGEFIPHPATYLRAGRFLDELKIEVHGHNGRHWKETRDGIIAKGRELGIEWTGMLWSEYRAVVIAAAEDRKG